MNVLEPTASDKALLSEFEGLFSTPKNISQNEKRRESGLATSGRSSTSGFMISSALVEAGQGFGPKANS